MENNNDQPISTLDWVITMLITSIPLVGFIMLLIWAFGSGTPKSKANWAKAALIWMVIGISLSLILLALFGGLILASMRSHTYY